ncbi:MAG: ABC transporter ATP-binding protein [Phycisphaerae bacterium]|nr:ABC transporter ATP-binding protein [Phycisphaerae bacterium]
MSETILKIDGLSVSFDTEDGVAKAVQDVSFSIERGKTFALVGESGCGKSVTAMSIMRLIPQPPGKIVAGRIEFEGQNLLALSDKKMRTVRGNRIAMIFQEPMTSLNPVYTVGNQIVEAIMLHQKKGHVEAWADAVELLRKVGIPEPQSRVSAYPHQMSGGMRQRVMIAIAMSCNPSLLIADEPTTALDVTIQAQILDLIDELRKQNNMSVLLITHDLGVVAERAENVAVMYASRIVESSEAQDIFNRPLHPYTKGLLKSIPRLGVKSNRLETIAGTVPNPLHFPSGCKFHPRCPLGHDDRRCQSVEPELREVEEGRCAACWYAQGYETKQEFNEYESKYGEHKRKTA